MKEVTELTNESKGTWNVQTETSSYIFDMDKKVFMRKPYTGAGIDPDHSENRYVITIEFGDDWAWLPFDTIKHCVVGGMMFFYTTPGGGVRRSTIVRKIQQVYLND